MGVRGLSASLSWGAATGWLTRRRDLVAEPGREREGTGAVGGPGASQRQGEAEGIDARITASRHVRDRPLELLSDDELRLIGELERFAPLLREPLAQQLAILSDLAAREEGERPL
jgi:hypothetical protein